MSEEPLYLNDYLEDVIHPLDREEVRKSLRLIIGGKKDEEEERAEAEKPVYLLRRAGEVNFGNRRLRHQRRWSSW
jgi:hypothetical protein